MFNFNLACYDRLAMASRFSKLRVFSDISNHHCCVSTVFPINCGHGIHCIKFIFILTKLSSLAESEVFKMTTSGAKNGKNVVKMTFPFQRSALYCCCYLYPIGFLYMTYPYYSELVYWHWANPMITKVILKLTRGIWVKGSSNKPQRNIKSVYCVYNLWAVLYL